MDTSGDSVLATRPLFQTGEGGSIPTSPHQLTLYKISKRNAENCYEQWHYLGRKGFMATENFGVFFNGTLVGCISYGMPNAKNIKGYFNANTQQGWWEIKRLALSPVCPKNSESRVIAVSTRILRKAYQVKGLVTYADAGVGHVGTIYKASGFTYIGLTAQKTDLFIDGVKVGKKGQYRRANGNEKEEWLPRSRKHLFIKVF